MIGPEVVRAYLAMAGELSAREPLVRPYRSGLKWNPVDDRCTACR